MHGDCISPILMKSAQHFLESLPAAAQVPHCQRFVFVQAIAQLLTVAL
jgi:hypothetical protein